MNDRGYMQDDRTWVMWPVCPLVNRTDGTTRCAYLFASGNRVQPTIYHGNIWNPKPDDRQEKFSSFDAIIAAGWKVD